MDFFDEGQNVDYGVVIMKRFFVMFFVVLANWGMYLAFCQAYSYPRANRVIIVNIMFFAALFAFIFSLPKTKCLISFVIVVIFYLSRVLSCNSEIERQAGEILKYIRHRAFVYYNQEAISGYLSDVHFKSNASGQALILSILFVSVALMMASVLRGTRFVTIMLIVSVLSADMLYGMTPEPATALGLFASAIGLCGMAQLKNGGSGKWKVKSGKDFSFTPLCFLAAVVIISIFLGGVVYSAVGKNILAHHEKYWRIQSDIEIKVEEVAREIENKFENVMNNQRLNNNPPDQTGKIIMTLKTDNMPLNSIYLRERSSDTYNNNQWDSLVNYSMSNEESIRLFSENYDIINQLLSFSLSSSRSIFTGSELLGIHEIKMDMEYYSHDSNLIFPYWADIAAAYASGGEKIMSNGNDRSLSCSGYNFSFRYYDISEKSIMKLLNQSNINLTDSSLYDDYNIAAQKYYRNYPKSLSGLAEFADNIETVRSVSGGAELSYGRQCSYIRNNIWDKVSYSKELDSLPSGADFTEDFLLSGKRGYCVHYATAGTLLCRMKNLPARYVTGYRVDPSQFKKVNNRDGSVSYKADVPDTCGHAWTEVYKSYLGWVPVEMTEAENPDDTADFYNAGEDDYNFGDDVAGNDNQGMDDYTDSQTEWGEDDYNNKEDDGLEEDTSVSGEDDLDIEDDNGESAFEKVDDGSEKDVNKSDTIEHDLQPDNEEGHFKYILIIIIAVSVFSVIVALSVRYIILNRRIKARKEYESLDRSKKLLMRAGRIGKDSAKAVKLKYKSLSDRDIFGIFMRIGDGEITKHEIEELRSILERSAFAENEISEERFAVAGRILDKVERKVKV